MDYAIEAYGGAWRATMGCLRPDHPTGGRNDGIVHCSLFCGYSQDFARLVVRYGPQEEPALALSALRRLPRFSSQIFDLQATLPRGRFAAYLGGCCRHGLHHFAVSADRA